MKKTTDLKKIHAFAIHWIEKLQNKTTKAADFEIEFGNDCEKLGFIMDCGLSFREAYPRIGNNAEAFNAIASQITDVDFLGAELYSRWRGLTHWSQGWDAEVEDRFFIAVLTRLAQLAEGE